MDSDNLYVSSLVYQLYIFGVSPCSCYPRPCSLSNVQIVVYYMISCKFNLPLIPTYLKLPMTTYIFFSLPFLSDFIPVHMAEKYEMMSGKALRARRLACQRSPRPDLTLRFRHI
jgi:hypothetical protein